MEENKIAYRRNILIGSFITAALLIIYNQLTTNFGQLSGGLSFLLTVLFFMGPIIQFSRQYLNSAREPVFNYGKAFGFGALISLVASILFGIYVYIFYSVISPETLQDMIVQMEENLLQSQQDPEMIEKASESMKKFMTPAVMAVGSGIFYFLIGLVVSLFAAIFTRQKDSSNPFNRTSNAGNE